VTGGRSVVSGLWTLVIGLWNLIFLIWNLLIMQLFYHPELSESSEEITFDNVESQHIVRVLRKKENDTLWITNGLGILFKGSIIHANDKKCRVKIIEIYPQKRLRDYQLCIAIAPTKNMDRMEWFVEKATEIGIDKIIPIISEHSERKVLKTERLEKMAIAAMKQSGQYFLPEIAQPIDFNQFIKNNICEQKFIAHCVDSQKNSLKTLVQKGKNVLILIGPEGDFSEREINLTLKHDFQPIELGKTRLRTETAALVAVHSVIFANE